MELYKKHRPTKFADVVGQGDAIRVLNEMGKRRSIPHTLLFTGPSGCGKTTLARILCRMLGVSQNDTQEINASDFNGVQVIRDIRQKMLLSPLKGNARVWIMDEAHQLSAAAQDSFLKMLEDTPKHVYFMLATTDPQKLKNTIKTRATEIKLKLLNDTDMLALLNKVADREKFTLDPTVSELIIRHAEGSPRKALVLLNQVCSLEGVEAQLDAIEAADSRAAGIEIARLIFKKAPWPEVAACLKNCADEPETVRRIIAGYANTIHLSRKGFDKFSFKVLEIFKDPYFTEAPQLTAACSEALHLD